MRECVRECVREFMARTPFPILHTCKIFTTLTVTYVGQFYITMREAPLKQLDGKHVVFGKVVHGMEVLKVVRQKERTKEERKNQRKKERKRERKGEKKDINMITKT